MPYIWERRSMGGFGEKNWAGHWGNSIFILKTKPDWKNFFILIVSFVFVKLISKVLQISEFPFIKLIHS